MLEVENNTILVCGGYRGDDDHDGDDIDRGEDRDDVMLTVRVKKSVRAPRKRMRVMLILIIIVMLSVAKDNDDGDDCGEVHGEGKVECENTEKEVSLVVMLSGVHSFLSHGGHIVPGDRKKLYLPRQAQQSKPWGRGLAW